MLILEEYRLMDLRSPLIIPLVLALVAVSTARASASPPASPEPAAVEFFGKKVRPLLANNCSICDSVETNSKGGLRVDDRNGLIQGGNSGAAVVPGKPEESLLLQAVRHEDGVPKMPPKKKLTEDEVANLTR
jgi:hypothetical protein